ncbi:protease modulator HflC [Mangrovibrevibacter kandeliae]|uniref:protease modulator HflC n=1 Tax=Mangrovibrevibacter kandeliae TaxID=2968473 RepID=UPI0021180283|nr:MULTISPECIES: protease modulator HflC [unclassified Aurantimonas]MCQ8784038.1 protease modulator HflC [Aurantimonas sp. CSK15Z-1]MCW4116755.1 protease modulator HflC [Aurantimonas sp. MSK8Z-1]
MTHRLYGLLIVVAAGLFLLWNALFIVNAKEQALVLRFGEIRRVVQEPGLYFKLPFSFAGADNVQKLPKQLLRLDLDNIRVQVSGGKFYEVDAFLVYQIDDPARFRQTVSGSIPEAEGRLRTRLNAALRDTYGLRGFEAALSDSRAEMMREVRDQMRPDAASLGIGLTDVRIRRTDLTQEVSQQTFDRMKAERLAEAERLRARGNEAGQKIRAAADRQAVEIKAEAQRDSEILRGEGEAERSGIFASAFGKDPGFFDFYRSMQAYRDSLQNSGTTMVLSPDTEFFRYFKTDVPQDSAGSAAASTAPVGAAQEPTPAPASAAPAAASPPAGTPPAAPADATQATQPTPAG